MGDDEYLDVAGLMADVVLPVVRSMLRDAEQIEDLRLCWEGKPPRRGRSDLMLTITVEGEVFVWFLGLHSLQSPDPSDVRARLASDLQDFIAESRFGWGELRTYRD